MHCYSKDDVATKCKISCMSDKSYSISANAMLLKGDVLYCWKRMIILPSTRKFRVGFVIGDS